ncbi:GNAT family N-acetyltransferase [Gleimia coleocanis]|nr:GNAT family N-acetyltransferase [Gleimia coleocanis]
MRNLKLVKLSAQYQSLLVEMLDEWQADITTNGGDPSPRMVFRNDWHDFDSYLKNLEVKPGNQDGWVPDSMFFLYDADNDRFLGAVNIRHELNEFLEFSIGHIGDGIRPSQRRRGYGTILVGLALEECRKLGIPKALLCCRSENIASAKTIVRNGGILENVVVDGEGRSIQRYWVDLS